MSTFQFSSVLEATDMILPGNAVSLDPGGTVIVTDKVVFYTSHNSQ